MSKNDYRMYNNDVQQFTKPYFLSKSTLPKNPPLNISRPDKRVLSLSYLKGGRSKGPRWSKKLVLAVNKPETAERLMQPRVLAINGFVNKPTSIYRSDPSRCILSGPFVSFVQDAWMKSGNELASRVAI